MGKSLKVEIKDYQQKYSHIPDNFEEQVEYVMTEVKLKDKEIPKVREAIHNLKAAKWETFEMVVHLEPRATPRPRTGKWGNFYVSNAANYNNLFKKFIESLPEDIYPGIITTPCKMTIKTYHPIPGNMNRIETLLAELRLIYPLSKPDFDNLAKTYADMVQKYLLLDDSLVINAEQIKRYSCKPRIEISFKFMTKYDCRYNKKKIESWSSYQCSPISIDEKDSII